MADYNYPTGVIGLASGLAGTLGWRLAGNAVRAFDKVGIVATGISGNYHRESVSGSPEGTLPIPEGFIGRIIWETEGVPNVAVAEEWIGPGVYESLERLLGLGQDNWVLDDTVYDAQGNLTTGVIYVYTSAAHATTHDKVTGLRFQYNLVGVFSGLRMTRSKQIRVL